MSEKGPLDVYRDAANEYRGAPNQGCAIAIAIVLTAGIIWLLVHFGVLS